MKKLLLILTALLAALSIQAQTLYVLGCGDGLSYSESEALEVELVDGKYSFDVKNLSDLYVAFENWFDGHKMPFRYRSYIYQFGYNELGRKILPLERGFADLDLFTKLPFEGDYYIIMDDGDLRAKFYGRLPEYDSQGQLYYAGPSADGGQVRRMFSRLSDSEYRLDCTGSNRIPAGELFSIVGDDWTDGYGFGVLDGHDCVRMWQFGKFSMLTDDFEGVLSVKLNPGLLQPMEVTMTTTAGVDYVTDDVAPGPVRYFNLQGIEVSEPSNGIFVEQRPGGSRLVKK